MTGPTIHAAGGTDLVDPASLKPHPQNPRTHSIEQVTSIRATIERVGWTNPVITNEKGVILVGHGRTLAALQDPPIPQIPRIIARGLSKDEQLALMVADNRQGETSEWDRDALRPILERLGLKFDMAALGFSPIELPVFLANPNAGFVDPDTVAPEPKADPAVRLGDLWTLGNFTTCPHCGGKNDI